MRSSKLIVGFLAFDINDSGCLISRIITGELKRYVAKTKSSILTWHVEDDAWIACWVTLLLAQFQVSLTPTLILVIVVFCDQGVV